MSKEHIDYDKKGEVMNRELLLHSIHNTGYSTTKVAIIPPKLYEAAMLHFSAIHSNLQKYVSPDSQQRFYPRKEGGAIWPEM